MAYLIKNEDFIVILADKNLGPCILERIRYMQIAWYQHLSNEDNYEVLSEKVGR